MVLVVGAGIVGVSQALSLARRGVKVTLIDALGVGRGTSWGNSGFLCPSLVQPLGVAKVLSSDWHYRFPFPGTQAASTPLRWFGHFLREQQRGRYDQNIAALRTLAEDGADMSRELLGPPKGGLHIYRTRPAIPILPTDHLVRGKDRLAQIEPALQGSRSPIYGGRLVATDTFVSPTSLVENLAELCRDHGVEIRTERVQSLQRSSFNHHSTIHRVVTDKNTYHPRAVVLAVGHHLENVLECIDDEGCSSHRRCLAYLPPLLKSLGFSLTVTILPEYVGAVPLPIRAISDLDRMSTYLPMGENRMRIACFSDLFDPESHPHLVDKRRRQMRAYLEDLFPSLAPPHTCIAEDEFWIGWRVLAPSSVPIFRRLPTFDNLYLNTAHGRFGMTLGPATSDCLAQEIVRDLFT